METASARVFVRDPRVPSKCHVTLWAKEAVGPGAKRFGGTAVNLSRSGMRVTFREGVSAAGPNALVTAGRRLQVVVTLPFLYGECSALAEVMWVNAQERAGQERASECGLRFVEHESGSEKRLREFLTARPTQVVFVACSALQNEISAALSGHAIFPTFLDQPKAAHAVLSREEVSAIVVGDMPPTEAAEFLREVYTKNPLLTAPSVVLSAGADLSPFVTLVGDGQVFFLTQKPPAADEMAAIVLGCIDRYWVNVRKEEAQASATHTTDESLFQYVLARSQNANRQTSAKELCKAAEEGVAELTDATRAYCLFHDRESETLWSPAISDREEREASTAAGIVSYTARTQVGAHVLRVADDARYDQDADDPVGDGSERLMVEPVMSVDRHVAAVLVAVRTSDRQPFSKDQHAALRLFASQLSATFGRLVTQIQMDRAQRGRAAGQPTHPFAEDALQEYLRGQGEIGHVLRLRSPWMEQAFVLLFVVFVVGFLILLVARVNQYGAGHAIVRLQNKVSVAARAQGVVTQVRVKVGDHVTDKTVLAVIDDVKERSEFSHIEQNLDQELIRWLRDPSDAQVGKQIATLRSQRQVALSDLSARQVLAPGVGVVNDVRVLVGQVVSLGDTVVSLSSTESPHYSVIAVFPGRYRPQTAMGATLRLEFVGYPFAYQTVPLTEVGEEVVGPREARRLMGNEHADSFAIDGPVFVARADLEAASFEVDDVRYPYFDGLEAAAEVKLRDEPVMVMLVPGLRKIYDALGFGPKEFGAIATNPKTPGQAHD